MIATVWKGAVPEASVMEKLWLEGKLPPGIYPPISVIERYRNSEPTDEEEYSQIPDESAYVNSL